MSPSACVRPLAAIRWSAGEASSLAWLRAVDAGLEVHSVPTMCAASGLSKSHGLPRALIAAQGRAIGGAWLPALAGPGDCADVFDAALRGLRDSDHTHRVSGDIDPQAHRDGLEPACARASRVAVLPLWRKARDAPAQEVIARGVRARLVCADTRGLDASFFGADDDAALLERRPAGVCPVGEGSECHAFVIDAPGFGSAPRISAAPQRVVVSPPPLAPATRVWRTPVQPEGMAP